MENAEMRMNTAIVEVDRPWLAMSSMLIGAFVGMLSETSLNIALPTLGRVFSVGTGTLQWLVTGYMLMIGIVLPFSSLISKWFSTRQIIIFALADFTVGALISGFANSFGMLLFGRMIQGIGTGLALPLAMHIILEHVPLERRGFMVGVATMTTCFAPAIGPTYGGIILHHFDWNKIFLFLVPILAISFVVGIMSIPQRKIETKTGFNFGGYFFLALGLALLLVAIERFSLWLLLLSIMALLMFYFSNKKKRLISLNVFSNQRFVWFMYGALVTQAIALGISFIFPNYLQIGLHQNTVTAGLFMLPGATFVFLLAPVSGRLMDELGYFKPIVFGLTLASLGLAFLAFVLPNAGVKLLLCGDVATKIGMGLAASSLVATSLSQLEREEAIDGNSVLNTLQQFSGALSTTVVSVIFGWAQKTMSNGSMVGSRISIVLILAITLIALGLVLKLKFEARN